MTLAERDKIILTIIFSIIGCIFIILTICFLIWRIIRYYRLKTKAINMNERNHLHHRQQYQRSPKYISTKFDINHNNIRRTKKNRRSNTNDSVITLSFDPPHLINQNVKNLEKLLNSDSTLTANSWLYEETLPKRTCSYINSSNEPIYTSSSTVLTSISNLAIPSEQINTKPIHYLNELDHALRVKHPLKYSRSCRQTTDFLPFDYYRSISPLTETNSSDNNNNSLEPIYIRTSNTTLLHKVQLAQIRDDTAILY